MRSYSDKCKMTRYLADKTIVVETGIRLFSRTTCRTAAQATSEISFSLVTSMRLTFMLDVHSTLAVSCASVSVNLVSGDVHTAVLSSASRSPLTKASIFSLSSTSSVTPMYARLADFSSVILDTFVQLLAARRQPQSANGKELDVKSRGNVQLTLKAKGQIKTMDLLNTLYVPELRCNPTSTGKPTNNGS
uniref:Retrovirus-related Pol polyprotein from transposon TNT 1-94-like beta-barrel domain-containing protein n=1 Tax=Glossina austeni TaxID=7395 RepID=A0A1A9VFK9_GLOAU